MAPGKSLAEILEPDETRIQPYLSNIWGPTICAGFGFLAMCYINWGTRRPVFSGIQKHVAAIGVGGVIGKYWEEYRSDYYAEKDAVLRHYVQLHPEDFPVPDRVKFADVFQEWAPVR